MFDPLAAIILLMATVGHGGLHIALYNRINAFGFSRKLIKRISKAVLASTILLPLLLLILHRDDLMQFLQIGPDHQLPASLLCYGIVCLGSWIVFGVPWVIYRPIFGVEWTDVKRSTSLSDATSAVSGELSLSSKAKLLARVPGNQIYSLAIEHVELPIKGLPPALDGYRIAHLSDVHLTGHIHADFTKHVVDQANALEPDLMALTGDIIDSQHCVAWLDGIFSHATANDGCYFVLGNHDKRISDPNDTRNAMANAGWKDLGGMTREVTLSGVTSTLIGNDYPWFEKPTVVPQKSDFRFLLSHSPDQISWARKHNVHLMLAGHTHGGQGRLPLIGPILSPSIHGSRYASGDFYLEPTTMHVSRGLSGTHLVRIRCRPELSLLTLRCRDVAAG